MWLEIVFLIVALGYLFFRWATKNNGFFASRGLPYAKPTFFFGNMADVLFRKKSFFDKMKELYREADNARVFGMFEQRTPLFLICDPEILKLVLVKDFDHFVNHRALIKDENLSGQDLFTGSLFQMKDSKWRDMRSTLSPAFTGSKLRHMFELINQVAENTSTHLKGLEKGNKDGVEFDLKDFSTRYTNDIIASTAFGLQVNSFEDVDNRFYKIGKKITVISAFQIFKILICNNFPFLLKLFKLHIFDKETTDYFIHLVLDAMKYRKEHNIVRPDMINMLMEARGLIKSEHPKQHNREWSDIEIASQCFAFFFAGFETSGNLLCFTAHELMENPEVQERLYEEIQEVSRELNGKTITYEILQDMKYMDMVISEVLRKWPPEAGIDRLCNKDFLYVAEDGQRFEIKRGESLMVPIAGLQYDPKYFPNPEKFDPERFSDENKPQMETFAYMPFGMGPRNCIGLRFALLEAKALIYYMVRDFRIEVGKKTNIPIELAPNLLQLTSKNGFWLKFISRSQP